MRRPNPGHLCLLLLLSAPARAESAPLPQEHRAGTAPQAASRDPQPPDSLTGALGFGARLAPAVPFGRLSRTTSVDFSSGWQTGADAQLGLSPYLSVGLVFDFASMGPASRCSGCSARALGATPLVAYRLVQGTQLDPYVAFGAGYQALTLRFPDGARRNYQGLNYLRLTLGSDYHLAPHWVLGPIFDLAATHFYEVPVGERPAATFWQASLGLRLGGTTISRR